VRSIIVIAYPLYCNISLYSLIDNIKKKVQKRYFTILLDLLSKLYVDVLSVEVFLKIPDFVFTYGCKGIVNVT